MTAVITGASRGIGEVLARRFGAEGAFVVAVARTADPNPRLPGSLRDTVRCIVDAGGRAVAVAGDLSSHEKRVALVDSIHERAAHVDILVNNAAVSWAAPVLEFSAKRFELMWEVQVRAPFELGQLLAPDMVARGRGWVLNVSSRASEHPKGPPDPELTFTSGATVYGMCKAALERFSTGLASELHGRGVAVNSLAPSRVVATWGTEHHGLVPKDRPDLVEYPEEFAEAAVALCSGDPNERTGGTWLTDAALEQLGVKVCDVDGNPFIRPELR